MQIIWQGNSSGKQWLPCSFATCKEKSHNEKSLGRYTVSERGSGASRKHEIDEQQSVCSLVQSKMEEKQSHAKDQNTNTTEIKSLEGHDKGNKQVSIKHFFTKKGKT